MPMTETEFAEIMNGARALLSDMNTTLPARIVAYDAVTRLADVKPEIDKRTADGRVIEAPIIYGVQVKWLSSQSANAIISMPLNVGDGGELHFSQRSIEQFMEGSRVPNDPRMHDINDCFFAPGVHTYADMVPAEPDCLLVKIGSAIIRMYGDGSAVMTLPAGLTVDAPLTTITGDVKINGAVDVDETIHAAGQIKSDAEVIAVTTPLHVHTHTSTAPGTPTSTPNQ